MALAELCRCSRRPPFELGGGRYMFSPLGRRHARCSHAGRRPLPFTRLTTRADVPAADRAATSCSTCIYGPERQRPAVRRRRPGRLRARSSPPDLSDRPGGRLVRRPSGKIAIDPKLGRIQCAADVPLPQSNARDLLLRLPGRDRRRSLTTVRKLSCTGSSPEATSSRSSVRRLAGRWRARSPPGTSSPPGSQGSSSCPASSRSTST